MGDLEALDLEIELISSSLLPAESLTVAPGSSTSFDIRSEESTVSLHVSIGDRYPDVEGISIEMKGTDMGREEAEGWKVWVKEKFSDWKPAEDYPMYQLVTTHFLPLLAPPSPSTSAVDLPENGNNPKSVDLPHHALLTSHHLLSSTKRKNFIALSSSLSLVGFSKVGHPGIYYACGSRDDLVDWVREVKSWNWLALKVRVGVEPVTHPVEAEIKGGKRRGEWVEVEKIVEALEWLRPRGREGLLLDLGMGGGPK